MGIIIHGEIGLKVSVIITIRETFIWARGYVSVGGAEVGLKSNTLCGGVGKFSYLISFSR